MVMMTRVGIKQLESTIMKKNLALIATLAALTMVSCQIELVDVVNEPEQDVVLTEIGAVAQEIDTKAHVDGLQVKWNTGDVVAVGNNADEEVEFTLYSGANTASAIFRGDLGASTLGTYAVYPNSTNADIDGTTVTVDYLIGWDYGKSEVPMYGIKGASDVYTFYNIGGAIQVTYTNIPETTNDKFFLLTETHTGGEAKYITGPVEISNLDSTPTIELGYMDGQEVIVDNIDNDATEVTIIIPIPAGTGYNFRIELYEDGEATPIFRSVKNATNRTITANKITRFPAIDLSVIPSGTYAILAKKDADYYAMANTHVNNSSRLDEKSFTYGDTTTDDQSIVWTITSNGAISTIQDQAGKYLTASSSNNANVNNASKNNTIANVSEGVYTIVQTVSSTDRYLSRNDANQGFAFYANTDQNEQLYIVPITYVPLATWVWGAGDTEIDADDDSDHDIAVSTDATSVSIVVKNEDESAVIDWLTAVFDDSDPLNQVITYAAEENTGTSPRKAVIVVTASNAYGDKTVKITITQAGSGPKTLYSENFGDNGNNNTAVASATTYSATTSMFTDPEHTVVSHYSSVGKIGKNNIDASSGYSGASGKSAVWYTAGTGSNTSNLFTVDKIDISSATGISVSFGLLYKNGTIGTQSTVNVYYKVDDGSESTLSFTQPTSSTWTLCSGSIPVTGSSLKLRFEMVTTGGYTVRLDDIKVTGTK